MGEIRFIKIYLLFDDCEHPQWINIYIFLASVRMGMFETIGVEYTFRVC